MARRPLGRGLSALLGENSDQPTEAANELDIDLIVPNRDQPRTRFDEQALNDLAQSLSANGMVQPIVVRGTGDGKYQIIAGERRWRAAQKAGIRKVPVVVKEVADDKVLELALIENIQREELNPIEEARAFRKLIDSFGLTQEQLSERVGKERTLIATSLRLLRLPEPILMLIENGKISAGHGRALLLTDDRDIQMGVARQIAESGISVRETERLIKKKRVPAAETPSDSAKKDANIASAEVKLQRKFGTKVNISQNTKGSGKIEIEFYANDDLIRIYQMLIEQ